jgi:hypothetical protein
MTPSSQLAKPKMPTVKMNDGVDVDDVDSESDRKQRLKTPKLP